MVKISKERFRYILHEYLAIKKQPARWVPHSLKIDQMQYFFRWAWHNIHWLFGKRRNNNWWVLCYILDKLNEEIKKKIILFHPHNAPAHSSIKAFIQIWPLAITICFLIWKGDSRERDFTLMRRSYRKRNAIFHIMFILFWFFLYRPIFIIKCVSCHVIIFPSNFLFIIKIMSLISWFSPFPSQNNFHKTP